MNHLPLLDVLIIDDDYNLILNCKPLQRMLRKKSLGSLIFAFPSWQDTMKKKSIIC
jgi:hypothetical protein